MGRSISNKIDDARSHQISLPDAFCDHLYIRTHVSHHSCCCLALMEKSKYLLRNALALARTTPRHGLTPSSTSHLLLQRPETLKFAWHDRQRHLWAQQIGLIDSRYLRKAPDTFSQISYRPCTCEAVIISCIDLLLAFSQRGGHVYEVPSRLYGRQQEL